MHKNKVSITALIAISFGLMASMFLAGCHVDVKKGDNGEEKQVDISTPMGGIHVGKQADVADVGIPVYPGARVKEKDSDGSDENANVNLSGFGYGIKVVALEYESDDAPGKIVAFYRDQLKKYGNVLECRTSGLDLNMGSHNSKNNSNELTCEGEKGNNVELKVGKKDDQHIVAVKTQSKGSSFSLVYVRTHGKDSQI